MYIEFINFWKLIKIKEKLEKESKEPIKPCGQCPFPMLTFDLSTNCDQKLHLNIAFIGFGLNITI